MLPQCIKVAQNTTSCIRQFMNLFDVSNRNMSGALTPAETSPSNPFRICNVSGYDGRKNDVVYCHPLIQNERQTTIVFFGGDVQDFPENMQSHRDNKNYLTWNLENTARIIQKDFLDAHVVVVRPARMEYKTFSCFENFVPCGSCGVPQHTANHNAITHLEQLLKDLSEKIQMMSPSELHSALSLAKAALIHYGIETKYPPTILKQDDTEENSVSDLWWKNDIALNSYDIKLIGFSKGCVVLNQFLYEFHYLKTLTPDTNMEFIKQIKDMFWLDGGHSGGKNTWITSKPLLETFSKLGIAVHVHVTPYQIEDDRRPWIKKEEKTFYDVLTQFGASVERVIHFGEVPPNLFLHFAVLTAFSQPCVTKT